MHVLRVQAKNFMPHAALDVTLPETGTLLVTGLNGGGKSAIIESVAWACWNRTLRGSKPWREGQPCEVTITTDLLTICRRRTAAGTYSLSWRYNDLEAAAKYDTKTKGQAVLDKVIGTFDVWRKTHVLTSADAAQFTEATDTERKLLLEQLLGIDRIDAARERTKQAINETEVALDRATTAVVQRAVTQKHTCQTLAALQTVHVDPAPTVNAQELASMVRAARLERQLLSDREKSMFDAVKTKRSALLEVERRLARLAVQQCPMCGQPITDAVRAPLAAQVSAEEATVAEMQRKATAEAALVRDEFSEADDEYTTLAAREKTLAQQIAMHARQAKMAADISAQRTKLQDILASCETELAASKKLLPVQQKRMACLQAVQVAFSMKGFRASLLSDAIVGVETFTNAWLQIIAPDLSVTLSLGDKYEVKLGLSGAGGGFGYPALSSGERRRVDAACVLALADMSSQATGTSSGTMWLDEVFDSLDPAGISGVCEALTVLSESRAAVVITHNVELKSQVDAKVCLTMTGNQT